MSTLEPFLNTIGRNKKKSDMKFKWQIYRFYWFVKIDLFFGIHCWVCRLTQIVIFCKTYYSDAINKHCQRHNGPEGWVHITESRSSINFKISTKHQHLDYKAKVKILTKPSFRILTKIQLRNFNQTSAAKYWPNFSFKIRLNLNLKILTKVLKVWTKVKLYDQTSASKSATNCWQQDPHH